MHSKSRTKNPIALDFFCGAGGVTHGFKKAGINVIAGLDNNPIMKYPYETNNRPAKFHHADISDLELNKKLVMELLKDLKPSHKIFSACAPCQPFSSQNKNLSKDKRSGLLLDFFEMIEVLPRYSKPDIIFAENVGPMQSRGKAVLSDIIKMLDRLNYGVLMPKIHNAVYFGVPQSRKRLIFIAAKKSVVKKKGEIFNWDYLEEKYADKEKVITVEEAFSRFEKVHKKKLSKLSAGESDKTDIVHTARNLRSINIKRLRSGRSRTEWPKELWLDCHSKNYKGHSDVYGRMDYDKPAPTLTTKCNSISNGRYGHPVEDRAISLREAAILQTMDDYKFEEPILQNRVALQIGNAVPPKLAEKFGLFIKELLY